MTSAGWGLVILGVGVALTAAAAYLGAYFGAKGPKDDE